MSPHSSRVFINPEIVEKVGTQIFDEGCLSFPGVSEEIKRAERVKVRAQDKTGQTFELEADGLLAVAIEHEYDHLEQGAPMIDHVGPLKKRMMARKVQKHHSSR